MAYAALVSLVQTVNQILNHNHTPITLPSLHKSSIRSIRNKAIDFQSFLKNFPQINSSLEGQIREVACTAEDVIEYLVSEKKPSDSSSEFERHLKQVAEEFNSTAKHVVDYVRKNGSIDNEQRLSDPSPDTSSLSRRGRTRKDVVVGFSEEISEVKSQLNSSSSSKLRVLPIVGIGGMGKTTLTRCVYHDSWIMDHFDIRGWVTVSQDYSVGSIVLNLLASMKGIQAQRDVQSKIPGEDEIHKYLTDRRYLIVIDDMWSKKAWDDLRKLFPENNKGSCIIITTRLQDVAAYAAPSSSFHMVRFLNLGESWSLLQNKAFGDQDICPPNVEYAGITIARRCGGLPLSIVVVGGLLSKIKKIRIWKQIAENDGLLENIMSLSYTHLPHHLKSCFLYMGGFPEDYQINVLDLIKLWVAEGFIKCTDRSKSLEEDGEDCLEELVERGLVLVVRSKLDGKIKSCSLHDIVRDFCIRQGRQEKLLLPVLDYLPSPILRRHFLPLVLKNHKRISATWYDLDLKDSIRSSRTHSIICIPQKGYRRMGSLEKFRVLRVLHVLCRNDYWDWEPSQVFDLIYLTYLASNIPSNIVPSAISKLQNLQTLVIYRYEVCLPVEIWRLRQLRHLIAFSFQPLPRPEEEAYTLENFQTLSLATDFMCSERMIEMIPNVKKLGICYSGKKSGEGYHLDYLVRLGRLEKLKLEKRISTWPRSNPVFPLSLKKLTLSGWRLLWSGMKIVGLLPNLQVLKLRNYAFDGENWETLKGEFVNLRLLLIDESNLQHWTAESSHFPMLQCLMLHRCPHLSEIPIGIGHIPTLEVIEIDDHNQSLLYSAKRIQKKQSEESGNDDLQVILKHF